MGCLYKQPTRVVRETGGCLFIQPAQALAPGRTPVSEKVYESTVNAFSYFLLRLPCAALTTLVSTRESILFRVPPSSQCFRGGKSAWPGLTLFERCPSSADADSTKQQRSACAGSNYVWIMWEGVANDRKSECDVNESGPDRDERGCVNAQAH